MNSERIFFFPFHSWKWGQGSCSRLTT